MPCEKRSVDFSRTINKEERIFLLSSRLVLCRSGENHGERGCEETTNNGCVMEKEERENNVVEHPRQDFFPAGLFTQGVRRKKNTSMLSNLLPTKRTWVTALPPYGRREKRNRGGGENRKVRGNSAEKTTQKNRCRKQRGGKRRRRETLNLHTFHCDPKGLG